jgi:hypothetical protein
LVWSDSICLRCIRAMTGLSNRRNQGSSTAMAVDPGSLGDGLKVVAPTEPDWPGCAPQTEASVGLVLGHLEPGFGESPHHLREDAKG